MCSGCSHPTQISGISRGRFLGLAGSSLAAVALFSKGGAALAAAEGSLDSEMSSAAEEFGVPKDLLLAMGFINTLWEMPPPNATDYEPGDHSGRGDYGIMQLTQTPDKDTVGRTAELTGLTEEEIKTNRAANIRAGAALLADIQGAEKPDGPDGWQDAVSEYANGLLYAVEVYKTLEDGATRTISTGEKVELAPQEVEVPILVSAQAAPDYKGAVWRPADSSNYSNYSREASFNINKVIIHIGEGSYSGIISWFQNPSSNVSAHYVVSRNGAVTQMVRHEDVAYHAGNWDYNTTSIGIEHAGYASSSDNWTNAMYKASAKLTAYICKRHNVPIDKQHFVLHRNVPGIPPRSCPGYYFDLDRYIRLVKNYAGGSSGSTTYTQKVDNSSPRFSAPGSWDFSGWNDRKHGKNYRYTKPSRTGRSANYKFKIPTKAKYEVFAWYPSSSGYNNRTRYYIRVGNRWRKVIVNQRRNGGKWVSLGTYWMAKGDRTYVRIAKQSSGNGFIIADAVMIRQR